MSTLRPFTGSTLDLNDLRARRRRDRSVFAVQPPTEEPEGFVLAVLEKLGRDSGGEAIQARINEALLQEGLTEAVAKATARFNAGGIDRTQRLLLSTPPFYARILEQAMASPTAPLSTSVRRPAPGARSGPGASGGSTSSTPSTPSSGASSTGAASGAGSTGTASGSPAAAAAFSSSSPFRVDFRDTEGLVSFILRTLDADGGFRAQYAKELVEKVVELRGLKTNAKIEARVVEDLAAREVPVAAKKLEELVISLLEERRATLNVEEAVNTFAGRDEITTERFTRDVREGMIGYLQDLGVKFPAGGVTQSNHEFDEYFALAYNHAINTTNGAATDPIDLVRKKGAITKWDFSVDTFDGVEEQGVVPQNILAAGALDYVYNLGERLGMFKLADALVLRWASGAFDAEPGKPSADLYRYWKLRSERISPEERAMMYRRILSKGDGEMLSGMVENEAFPELWGTLMEKATEFIRRSEEASTDRTISRQPIYQATKQLQYNLTENATGMAHMQITEMYHHLIEAKGVLEHAINYFSTGSRKSLWTVIERASREWFDEAPNISAIRSAAIDGNRVFQWIAEFDQSSVTDDRFHEFLESAESWIISVATDDSEPTGDEPEKEIDEDEADDKSSDWDD
jgi:hypothetical protein